MSAYGDAMLRALIDRGGSVKSGDARRIVNTFLAALPPSIVVDGRVVQLVDERLLAVIRDEFGDHGVAAVNWLTQAVLEVAE